MKTNIHELAATATTEITMADLMQAAIDEGSSDLHIRVGRPPILRCSGALEPLDCPDLTPGDTAKLVLEIATEEQIDEVERNGGADFGLAFSEAARFRVSVFKERHNYALVLRQIPSAILTLEQLGLPEAVYELLTKPRGLILVTGPTGSGKSSSMYTMIGKLNTEEVNLVTLEDPVEYNFDGVNQVQINEKTGMTFSSGLRSILRQDPDIIAVGEIRDGETADIAMRAAITGHLVLSTLHTNDAPSTIDRLLDMGVESFLISSALKGVISQRLVRRICPSCRVEYTASEEEQRMLHMPYVPGRKFYKGKGCPLCFNTGYKGRTAVFEILTLTAPIKHAIADNVPHSELMRLIEESDFEPLINDCVKLVLDGTTTAEEAFRTVNSTDA